MEVSMQQSLTARVAFRVLALFVCAAFGLVSSGSCQGKVEASAEQKELRKAAQAAVQAGEFGKAVAAFQKLTEADPKDGRAWHMLGYCLHAEGKLDEALKIHQKACEFPDVAAVASYNAACVFALKKDKENALSWLEKAVERGFSQPEYLETDTDLDFLRKEPRFEKILAGVQKMAKDMPVGLQAYVQDVERRNTRIAWFSGNDSHGQVALDYSPVPWQAKYEAAFAAGKLRGTKWRLGSNFWTSLDTSVGLVIGGVKVPAGYYYVTAEQRDEQTFVLVLHDAVAVKKLRLDAFECQKLQGGIDLPMQHVGGQDVVDHLDIKLEADEKPNDHGTLTVRFGGHVLTAAIVASLGT
jgi:Tfp pilus assembly protein PilF